GAPRARTSTAAKTTVSRRTSATTAHPRALGPCQDAANAPALHLDNLTRHTPQGPGVHAGLALMVSPPLQCQLRADSYVTVTAGVSPRCERLGVAAPHMRRLDKRLCRKIAFWRRNPKMGDRKINGLEASTFLFSVMCVRAVSNPPIAAGVTVHSAW